MAVGMPGGINRFYNSVMGSDEITMIDQFSKIINSVANADSSVMFIAGGQGTKGEKRNNVDSLFSKEYYADTAEGHEIQVTVGSTEYRFIAADRNALPANNSPIFYVGSGSSTADAITH